MNNQTSKTQVWLTERQQKFLILIEWLYSKGLLDLKLTRAIIDFDANGLIGNYEIIQHNKLPEQIKIIFTELKNEKV